MGLFDKILGGASSATLSKPEAFAGVMLAAVAADGHISDEETAGFNATIAGLRVFQAQTGSEHRAMIDKLFGILKRNGASQLLAQSACALPPELRQAAFAVVADLIFSDGSVEDTERSLLEQMQEALEIPIDLALQIVQVMSIKNTG